MSDLRNIEVDFSDDPKSLPQKQASGFIRPQAPSFDGTTATPDAMVQGVSFADDPKQNPKTVVPSEQNAFLQGVVDHWNYYSAQFQVGNKAVAKGYGGLSVLSGQKDYETAKVEFADSELDKHNQDIISTFESKVPIANPLRWIGPALNSLPQMGHGLAGGAAGAAIGAATEGITGAIISAPVPAAEPVVTGVSALTGAGVGFKLGQFNINAGLMSGQAYMDLRERGISDEKARPAAIGIGVVNALLESVQFHQMSGIAKKAFAKKLLADKKTLVKKLLDFAATVNIEISEEIAQEIVEQMGTGIAAVADGKAELIPNKDESRAELLQTWGNAAQASLVLSAAGAGIGKGARKILGEQEMLAGAQPLPETIPSAVEQYFRYKNDVATVKAELAKAKAEQEAERTAATDAVKQDITTSKDRFQLSVAKNQKEGPPTFATKIRQRIAAIKAEIKDAQANMRPTDDLKEELSTTKRLYEIENAKEKLAQLEQQADSASLTEGAKAILDEKIADTKAEIKDIFVEGIEERIDKRLRQEEADVAKAEQELADAESKSQKGVKLHVLKGKIDQGKANIEALQAVKELAAQEQMDAHDVEKLYNQVGKYDVEQISNSAIQRLSKLSKDTVKWGKDTAKATRKVLSAFLKTSGLSVADRQTFAGEVAKVVDSQSLKKLFYDRQVKHKNGSTTTEKGLLTRVKEAKEERKLKDAETSLIKTVHRGRTETTDVGQESKFSHDPQDHTQTVVDSFARIVNEKPEKGESKSGAMQRAADRIAGEIDDKEASGKPLSFSDMVLRDVAEQFLYAFNVSNNPAEALTELKDTLKTMMKQGFDKRIQEIAKEKAAIEQTADELVKGIFPGKTDEEIKNIVKPTGALVTPERSKREASPWFMKINAKTFGISRFNWSGLIDVMLQKMPKEQREKFHKLLDLGKAAVDHQTKSREYIQSFLQSVSKKTGLSYANTLKHLVSIKHKEAVIEYIRTGDSRRDVPVTDRITVPVLIDIFLQMRDPDLIGGLREGNQYTFIGDLDIDGSPIPDSLTTEYQVREALKNSDPTGINLKVAEGIADFYRGVFKDIASEFRKDKGLDLPFNANYSGRAVRLSEDLSLLGSSDKFKAYFDNRRRFRSVQHTPGFVHQRVDTKLAVLHEDAIDKLVSHMQESAHWQAYRAVSKFLNGVFSDGVLKRALDAEYPELRGMIETSLEDNIKGNHIRQDLYIKNTNETLGRMGPLVLFGKLDQYVKQFASGIVAPIMLMNTRDYISGLTHYYSNKKLADEIMSKEPWLQNRIERGVSNWMAAVRVGKTGELKQSRLGEILGIGLLKGDEHVSRAAAWAVYQNGIKQGLNHDEAMRKAGDMVEQTQSSNRVDLLNSIASNPYYKGWHMFKTQPTIMAQFRELAWREALNHFNYEWGDLLGEHNSKLIAQVVKTEIASRLSSAAFVLTSAIVAAATNAMLGIDSEEDKDKAIASVIYELVGPGATGVYADFVNFGAAVAWNNIRKASPEDVQEKTSDLPEYEPSTIPLSILKHTLKLEKKLVKSLEDGTIDTAEMLEMSMEYAKSVHRVAGPKLPLEPVVKTMMKVNEGIEANDSQQY